MCLKDTLHSARIEIVCASDLLLSPNSLMVMQRHQHGFQGHIWRFQGLNLVFQSFETSFHAASDSHVLHWHSYASAGKMLGIALSQPYMNPLPEDIPGWTVLSGTIACALPTSFSAMHWYIPSSSGPTLETLKAFRDSCIRWLEKRRTAFRSHTTVGWGFPRTLQVNFALWPHVMICWDSSMLTSGGSEKKTQLHFKWVGGKDILYINRYININTHTHTCLYLR